MATRAEAREHVESFWARRGISKSAFDIKGNLNLRDLSASLNILSETLYPDITHFIWELFQNADDSKYADSATPCLNLTLTKDSLVFKTNEIGFTKDDVESLCAIGFSSKAGQNDTIGEKGIGFKSVFRVANVVSIHSGVYTFQLDIRPPYGKLGMILPVWLDTESDFSGTSITLQLMDGIDRSKLYKELSLFDFSFLLFSRKIKIIDMSLEQSLKRSGKFIQSGETSCKIEIMVNDHLCTTMTYEMYLYTLSDMPRRPGAQETPSGTQTTVIFAFPHCNQQPDLRAQKTYAFLPIASFGFDFLIHADFVLTANRQDIQDVPWNTSLQLKVSNALCMLFKRMSTSAESIMRYSWPEYLYCLQYIHNQYMRTIAEGTRSALRSQSLVEMELSNIPFRVRQDSLMASDEFRTTSGKLLNTRFRAPQDSLMASDEFRTTLGKPLITSGTHALRVMSRAYSDRSSIALMRLGVTSFEISHFIKQLEDYTSSEFANFSSENEVWHSRVAELLWRYFYKYSDSRPSADFTTLSGLKIIPLNDRSWISGSSNKADNILLGGSSKTPLPRGLDVRFVEAKAATNPNRRKLYRLLGIKVCDEIEISKIIVKYHATARSNISANDLKSHAVYVFRARYQPESGDLLHLRLVDSNGNPQYHSRVHLPFGRIGSDVRRLFADDFGGIVWLDSSYQTMVTDSEKRDWIEFLSSLENVYEWPPLVSREGLSDEMRHIWERNGSTKFLGFLKMRNSRKYGGLLMDLDSTSAAIQTTEDIKNLEVLTDRGTSKLRKTIMPSLSDHSLRLLPVLQLDDPDDAGWDFLRDFGVLTTLSPEFYVRQILYLKASNNQGRTKEMAKTIYEAIGVCPGLTASQLTSFQKKSLIYVDPDRWLFPRECVWRASFRCTKVPILSKIYRKCGNLFQTLLGVRDAGLDDLISELDVTESSDDLERAKVLAQNMLPALDTFLGKVSPSESQRRKLASGRIFPVTQIEASTSASIKFCKAGENFWIADMNWLKLKFEGLLPLLDVTESLFKKPLENIIKVLSMDHKRLSKSVQTEQVQHDGVPQYDALLTTRLRKQSQYIIGIVSKADNVSPRLEEVRAKLSSVHVFRVQDITIKRFVFDHDDRRIYGRDDQGEVNLVDVETELRINIRQGIDIVDTIVPLTNNLAGYLNLGGSNRELLSKVLTTEREAQFMESLESAGVKIAPNTAVQDEAEPGFDEDSDDATIDEDPGEGLDLAFQRMQINEDSHFGETRPQRRSTTSASQSPELRSDTRVDSAIPKSRWVNAPSNRAEVATTTTPRPVSRTEQIENLTARLRSTTLLDRTADVLHPNFTAPAAEAAGSGESQRSIIDSTTSLGFTPNSTVSARNSRTTSSTSRRIPSDNTVASNLIPSVLQSSFAKVDAGQETLTRSYRYPVRHATPGRASRSSYNDNNIMAQDSSADTPHEIGFFGEHLVYRFFEKELSPLFTYQSWTSRNRNKVFPDHPFGNRLLEKDFADFTYVDTDGKLGQYLGEKIPGFKRPTSQSNITYHLEVKTTESGLETPALLSNNQISMAKMYSQRFSTSAPPGTHVYMLVRVYGLRYDPPRPQFCLFPDPWALICEGLLQIKGDNGVYVWPNSSEPLSFHSID